MSQVVSSSQQWGDDVSKLPCLELLLHNQHYYTINDIKLFSSDHYVCPSCGHDFKHTKRSTIKRRMTNWCGKTQKIYRSGAIKAYTSLWTEIKEIFYADTLSDHMISDDIIEKTSLMMCTYDFEARQTKVWVEETNQATTFINDHGVEVPIEVYDNDGTTRITMR